MNAPIARSLWMSILAKALPHSLEQCCQSLGTLPAYHFLRAPEIGMTMVRGRAGGTGQLFNLGEITMTRCAVYLEGWDMTGFGYVAGRSRRHAELAALCDALLQLDDWHEPVMRTVIEPLQAIATAQQQQQHEQTAATRVNFYTLLRGEG